MLTHSSNHYKIIDIITTILKGIGFSFISISIIFFTVYMALETKKENHQSTSSSIKNSNLKLPTVITANKEISDIKNQVIQQKKSITENKIAKEQITQKRLKIITPKKEKILKEKPIEVSELEETKLPLNLVGSFITTNRSKGFTIISNGESQTKYRINQKIEGYKKVLITSIFHDKVILNNNGQHEILSMYNGKWETTNTSIISAEPKRDTTEDLTKGLRPSEKLALINRKLSGIDDILRLSIQRQDREIIGFAVNPGRNREAFSQSAFQTSDIITQIDGIPLNNMRIAQQTWQKTKQRPQANFIILREGYETEVELDITNL